MLDEMTKIRISRHAERGLRLAARRGVRYLFRLPAYTPAGRVLVQNHVTATRRLGARGIRARLSRSDPARLVRRGCTLQLDEQHDLMVDPHPALTEADWAAIHRWRRHLAVMVSYEYPSDELRNERAEIPHDVSHRPDCEARERRSLAGK